MRTAKINTNILVLNKVICAVTYKTFISGVLLNVPSPMYDNLLLFKNNFCNCFKCSRLCFSMCCRLL